MVLLTGPRQVGKTFLAQRLQREFRHPAYLNHDLASDARIIRRRAWPLPSDLVVLDEIHKMKGWKRYLKGVFDTRTEGQSFLVTGSARLDTFRQAGESLAGRYYSYRLLPLSVKELDASMPPFEAVEALNRLGGFPEPFLSGSEEYALRWRRQYYTDIVREDILDFSRIHELRSMRLILEMLRKRVGAPLSCASLAQDAQISPNTVRKYVDILESLHILFLIRPFHRNIARSLLKEPKVYFYDSGFVDMDEGARLENTVATCLLKHAHFLEDSRGRGTSLHYLRTKTRQEVDFALAQDGELTHCIEVKLSDPEPSPALRAFRKAWPGAQALQLVHNLSREREADGASVVRAGDWLSQLAA
jgi:predicted AAA+ superfamily ATPase